MIMANENERIDTEIDFESLDGVSGGTSGKSLDKGTGAVFSSSTASSTGNIPLAYCTTCNFPLRFIDQVRKIGGNTGMFKCTNPKCKKYGVIVYGDDVKW